MVGEGAVLRGRRSNLSFVPRLAILAIATALAVPAAASGSDPRFDALRRQMVAEIEAMARATGQQTGYFEFSPPVLQAMATVPRHRFVPDEFAAAAYRNHPLPIGQGQTISQPYIVALSTALLEPKPGHVVLEIGTGSGYQAAVLAELVDRVHSIEIVEPLGREAARRLAELGYRNVEVRIGDGYRGWPEHAPFDGIVVTAAAQHVPEPLVQQLKPGGRMVIPVGESAGNQELLVVEKAADGTVRRRVVIPVRFVPLTGSREREAPRSR
jgi:protein-L-isoaspartate(D-aspartate) O-methyltransferase